jgi:hypothetical protein
MREEEIILMQSFIIVINSFNAIFLIININLDISNQIPIKILVYFILIPINLCVCNK